MSGAPTIETLLAQAAAAGASDVALEPQDDGGLLALARIDGLRRALAVIPAADAPRAIARLKALAALPGYVSDEPQDGAIPGAAIGIVGSLRLACLPTVRGQRLALRLPVFGTLPAPEALGLEPVVLAALRRRLRRRDGLVLVTGPVGSGKTTTIHSLLAELAAERPDRQVVTIEDPVERRLPGVAHVAVAPARGFGYHEAIAAALRQDADVLVVGEVRDRATAAACLTAALTGHLVVSTLHCGRATEAMRRMADLGVDPGHLRSALAAVLAQRLLRRRHDACTGAGCAACRDGFLGRLPVCDLLLEGDGGMTSATDLDAQAAALVQRGLTTAAEVERCIA